MKVSKVKRRIISFCLIVAFSIAYILGAVAIYRNEASRAVNKISKIYMEELAQHISVYFETNINNYYDRMETVALSIGEKELADEEELSAYLKELKEINDFYEVALVDDQGIAFITDQHYPIISKVSKLSELLNGEIDRFLSFNETIWGSDLFLLGIPLTNKASLKHNFVALLVGIEIDDVRNEILITSNDANSFANITNKNGSFILRNDNDEPFIDGYNILSTLREKAVFDRTFSYKEVEKDISEGKSNICAFTIGDQHKYLYYTPIANTELYVFMGMPYETVNNQIVDLTTFLVAVGLMVVVLVFAIILITFLSYRRSEKKYQTSLLAEKEKAVQANKYKDNFLSQVSHEIRTPMNGIMGMIQIGYLNINNPVKIKNCFEKIELSSNNLLALINDILDIAKIESGKTILYRDEFDFIKLLKTIVTTFYDETKKNNLNFNLIIGEGIEQKLIGDSLRLNQIFNNLFSNAIKFTPANGTITFEIEKFKEEEQKIWLRLVLSDTGKGISEENISRIFESFMQEDVGIYKKYGGTGLGLPITKHFVEMMGGTISVSSKVGFGSTFVIEIPFDYIITEIEIKPQFEGKKVLLVYENYKVIYHLYSILTKKGIIVNHVKNIQAANEYLKENKYDCDFCILDNNNPDLVKFISESKKKNNDMKYLLIGYDLNELEEKVVEVGADSALQRPVSSEEVDNLLNRLINNTEEIIQLENNPLFVDIHILVVEDNEINREMVVELLETHGAIVDVAVDGKVAVDKFIENEDYYDIILMDLHMPNLDGYGATEAIRNYDRHDAKEVIIIAMTANAFPDDIKKCIASGMDSHISKPFALSKVYDTYQTILQKKNK